MRLLLVLCALSLLRGGVLCVDPASSQYSLLKASALQKLKGAFSVLSSKVPLHAQDNIDNVNVPCAVCGLAVNELEGFMVENATTTAMKNFLQQEVCSHMDGLGKEVCDGLTYLIPDLLKGVDNRWSVGQICVDLGACKKPLHNEQDPQPVPTVQLNLDLPPEQRWTKICSEPAVQKYWQHFVSVVDQILPGDGVRVEEFGRAINKLIGTEYSEEIRGCGEAIWPEGPQWGWLTLLNIGYEVSDACSSMIAEGPDGIPIEARNLDFWAGGFLTTTLRNVTKIVDVMKGGKLQYKMTTFTGFVGALSGMKPNVFTSTVNTRFYPGGVWQLFTEVLAAIEEPNPQLVAFLLRDTLMSATSFDDAVHRLGTTDLVADVYYTIGGTKSGEGVVLARNRTGVARENRLDPANGKFYVYESNYDWWKPAPWFDNRRGPAEAKLNSIGRNGISIDSLWDVLSLKPVFNIQTTYSYISVPHNGTYRTFTRWCPYPCVE